MTEDIKMGRRGFFKRSLGKVASAGSQYAEHKVTEKAKGWIRPPFALDELDFLLKCSRCTECIDACPHHVIFPLPIQRGASVVATPAMDIANNACQLCTDWACVNACKEGALSFSTQLNSAQKETIGTSADNNEEGETPKQPGVDDCPPMASAKVNKSLCMPYSGPECGACRGVCPISDTLVWKNEKPEIKLETCIGCGLCRAACITSPKAIEIMTYQEKEKISSPSESLAD